MRILHFYFSATGNTKKVAATIDQTLAGLGHKVESFIVGEKTEDLELLDYDMVFAGSGVYQWMPGKPMQALLGRLLKKYVDAGEIKPASPRRPGKKAVVYCTYGGVHTGINEAVPAVKYMAQLFDHLGFDILAEWYIPGAYVSEKLKGFSVGGRLGDIQGRPNAHDLQSLAESVKGILKV